MEQALLEIGFPEPLVAETHGEAEPAIALVAMDHVSGAGSQQAWYRQAPASHLDAVPCAREMNGAVALEQPQPHGEAAARAFEQAVGRIGPLGRGDDDRRPAGELKRRSHTMPSPRLQR